MKVTFGSRWLVLLSLASCSVLSVGAAHASDLIEARPLTDEILLLRFDDGYIEYHGYGQSSDRDTAVNHPLDLGRAASLATYLISSPDDPVYASPVQPARVGRKSKGKDFSRKCQWNGSACVNEIVFEHQIYLVLPSRLESGKTYRVELGELAGNLEAATILFDERRVRSEAIHVNQVGYLPECDSKFAYVSHWLGDLGSLSLDDRAGTRFEILDARTRQTVYAGDMRLRSRKTQRETGQSGDTPGGNFSNADVWECDFSTFGTSGEYVVSVQGIGCSFPFEIGPQVYRQAFYLTARALYHQRAGLHLDERFTDWPRPADHSPILNGTSIRYTTLRFMDQATESGNKEEVYSHLASGNLESYGWYHDAGDWDGYPSHSVVPKSLMTIYELAPERFADGELNLPESGNRIPDILDEAAWLVNYYRRNVGPTGGIFGSRITGDLAGGDADGVPSWEDPREWVAFGEEPLASFDFAGMAAQLAYCLKQVDTRPGPRRTRERQSGPNLRREAGSLLESARRAYSWAENNLRPGDEAKVRDARMYAAAWLYKTSRDPAYQDQFRIDNRVRAADTSAFESQKWGVWAYVTIPDGWPGLDQSLKSDLTAASKAFADSENLSAAGQRSYRQGGHFWMPMLIGQATTPWVMPSIVAYELGGDPKYLRSVINTADYMLGGNPLNMTWVTGLGHRSPREILHLDAWYDGIAEVIPGIVPYGPHRGDRNGWNGPWDPDYARDRAVYPEVSQWPGHELYFENRYCPITNEFTIHQNIAPAAAVYAYLAGPPKAFSPNRPPSAHLYAPLSGAEYQKGQAIVFGAAASDADGWISRVEFYLGRHKVGEAMAAPYSCEYRTLLTGSFQATAVAYDNKGRRIASESVTITVRPHNAGRVPQGQRVAPETRFF